MNSQRVIHSIHEKISMVLLWYFPIKISPFRWLPSPLKTLEQSINISQLVPLFSLFQQPPTVRKAPSKSQNPQTNKKSSSSFHATFIYYTHTPITISTNRHTFSHCPTIFPKTIQFRSYWPSSHLLKTLQQLCVWSPVQTDNTTSHFLHSSPVDLLYEERVHSHHIPQNNSISKLLTIIPPSENPATVMCLIPGSDWQYNISFFALLTSWSTLWRESAFLYFFNIHPNVFNSFQAPTPHPPPPKRHFPTFQYRTSSFCCVLFFFCIRLSKDPAKGK